MQWLMLHTDVLLRDAEAGLDLATELADGGTRSAAAQDPGQS